MRLSPVINNVYHFLKNRFSISIHDPFTITGYMRLLFSIMGAS